ncbi:MAG TPA: hypothetical protein VIB78_14410 [Acidimicrobiia bacterium]
MLALAATWAAEPGPLVLVAVGLLMAGSVLAPVHHAEVIAHRVGEPFGSLALAVTVTVIEVTLIVTPDDSRLVGALRRGTASVNAEGRVTLRVGQQFIGDGHELLGRWPAGISSKELGFVLIKECLPISWGQPDPDHAVFGDHGVHVPLIAV